MGRTYRKEKVMITWWKAQYSFVSVSITWSQVISIHFIYWFISYFWVSNSKFIDIHCCTWSTSYNDAILFLNLHLFHILRQLLHHFPPSSSKLSMGSLLDSWKRQISLLQTTRIFVMSKKFCGWVVSSRDQPAHWWKHSLPGRFLSRPIDGNTHSWTFLDYFLPYCSSNGCIRRFFTRKH